MTWNEVVSKQIVGKTFRTWSVTGKARAIEFKVDSIDQAEVVFRKQNGKPQRASRVTVEILLENWDLYKKGEVSRKELMGNNFSTSYLFGVLHALEEPTLS